MAHVYARLRDPTEVLGRRIAAYAIDVVLLSGISVLLLATAKHSSLNRAPDGACATFSSFMCYQVNSHVYLWNRGQFLRAEILGAVAAFLDLVVLQSFTGASIGKLLVGLRVIDERGQTAGFPRVLGRTVALAIDAGCFLIGLITVLATHPHRRFGDIVSGTYVVARSSVGQPMFDAAAYGSPSYTTSPPQGWSPAGYAPPASWSPPGVERTVASQWGKPKPPPAAPPPVAPPVAAPPVAPSPAAPAPPSAPAEVAPAPPPAAPPIAQTPWSQAAPPGSNGAPPATESAPDRPPESEPTEGASDPS